LFFSKHILVKYYGFEACKYYFNNLVNLVFVVENRHSYIELHIDVTYRFVETIIIIVVINKDANAERENREDKDEILSVDRADISANYILN